MRKLKRIILLASLIAISSDVLADGFSAHVEGGWAYAKLGGEEQFYVSHSVENQYITQNLNTPYIGVGGAYQWDQPLAKVPHVALNLGLTLYYLRSTLQGSSKLGVNLAPPGVTFDRLEYAVDQSSAAAMIEPKFIYTAYSWQPYMIAGIGAATNHMGNYKEAASGSAAPNAVPFSGNTTNNFAYSIGVGLQHKLVITPNENEFIIGLGYRYMNWGTMRLGPSPVDSTGQEINFGKLQTSLIGANLIWNF